MNVQEKLGDFVDSVTGYDIAVADFYNIIVNNENLTFGEWTEVVANHMVENYMIYNRDIYEWVSRPDSPEAVNEYVRNGYCSLAGFDLTEVIQRAYAYDVSAQLMNEEDYITEYALLRILDDKGFEEIDDDKYADILSDTVTTYEIDFETIVKLIEEELQ